MSQDSVRIGKTIDEATKFAFGNVGAIVRIGWFPTALMIGLVATFAWTFWQPLIVAYFSFFQDYMAAATDPDELMRVIERYPASIAAAAEQVGAAKLGLGYLLIIVTSMIGTAIPLTAYIRMMVLGERPAGPLYFRLGGREVGVAVTYLAVVFIATLAITAASAVGGIAMAAAANGSGEPSAIFAFLTFLLIIFAIVAFFWVFARLILAVPASAVHGGIPLGAAWRTTRGLGGRIAWIIVLGYLILMAITTVAMMVLSMGTGLIEEVLIQLGSHLAPYFVGVLWGIGYLAVACFSAAFFAALFTGPYVKLTQGE